MEGGDNSGTGDCRVTTDSGDGRDRVSNETNFP